MRPWRQKDEGRLSDVRALMEIRVRRYNELIIKLTHAPQSKLSDYNLQRIKSFPDLNN